MRYIALTNGTLVKSEDFERRKRGQWAIAKSTVRTHQRKTKTGKVVNVQQYQNIKTKKKPDHHPSEKRIDRAIDKTNTDKYEGNLDGYVRAVLKTLQLQIGHFLDRDEMESVAKKIKSSVKGWAIFEKSISADLRKSLVRSHQRKTKGGKIVPVKQYENIKTKKETGKEEHIRGLNTNIKTKKEYIKKIFGDSVSISENGGIVYDANPRPEILKKITVERLDKDYNKVYFDGKLLLEKVPAISVNLNTNKQFKTKKASYLGKIAKKLLDDLDKKHNLSKSLEFNISGQRIREGTMMKIGELKAKLSILKGKQKQGVAVKSDDISEISTDEAVEIKSNPVVSDWEIKSCERNIERLERIVRNIDPKKKFKLNTYELDEYGL